MQIKQFKEELFRLSWFTRGGVSVTELLHYYSAEDREILDNVIKSNLETTKDSGLPFF